MLPDVFDDLAALAFTDDEVAAVLGRARERSRPRAARMMTFAAAVFVLALAVVIAVPRGRAGLSDAIDRFFAGGEAPGKAVGTGEPGWLETLGTDPHLLAASGSERLFAYRSSSGESVCFDFGSAAGLCIPMGDGADELFRGQPVALWGPTHRDAQGRWILWGIARDGVARVALRYDSGPPTETVADNGFILRGDPNRNPQTLVAFDRQDNTLGQVDVSRRFALAPVGG
jgi:hypothetical protein